MCVMKRKTFIRLSSILMSAPLVSPLSAWSQTERLKNWAGNFTFSTDNVHYPTTVEQVQKIVKSSSNVRPLGTRHCFNRIADSKHSLISLTEMNKVVEIDANAKTVTVDAGIKYGDLSPYLHERGWALHNLASLPHISVAGSIATATHGSGVGNCNLATAVTGIQMVVADATVVNLSKQKDGENFLGSVVALGALGVVTKLTLSIQPTFNMRQYVFTGLPLKQLADNFNEIVAAGYSISLFTDWQQESINEVWIKSRVDDARNYKNIPEFFGAVAAAKNLHPIAEVSAENCTEQLGVEGTWYERMPHFKMGFTPSSGVELQTEYFINQDNAVEAIMAIHRMGKKIGPHLFISEIRTIAADDLWMSPCRNQPSVALHFTWKQETDAVMQLLPQIEKELEPFKPRPHWGKLFTMSPRVLAAQYEKLDDFKKLMAVYDPKGKYRNDFVNDNLFPKS